MAKPVQGRFDRYPIDKLELHLTYYKVERLGVMLLLGALALMVAWLMGKATQLTNQHRQYQANTITHRLVLSTIFLGLKVINDTQVSLVANDIDYAWAMLDEIIENLCEIA